MSTIYNPYIGPLQPNLYLDASNVKSYPGSGSSWKDLSTNSSIYASSSYTYPSWANGYFTFVNNGTTQNNIKVSTQNLSTYSTLVYTRVAWFRLTGNNSAWSPIIQNSIGNNSDMGLTINNNKLHFRQYTNSGTNGTTSGDYGVSGTLTVNLNTWYQAAIVVNRLANTVSFYLNGVLDSTVSTNIIGNSSSDTIIIGGADTDSYAGDRMFKGNIGVVMHYNSLLTLNDIQTNFFALRGRYGI